MGSLRPPPPLQPSVFCFLLPVEGVTSFFSTSLGLAPPGLDSPRSNRLGGPHPAPCRLWAAWSPSPLPATRLPGRFLPGARPSGSPWLSAPSGPGENAALKGGVTCPRTGWSAQGCQVPGPQGPQVSGEASPFGLRLPGFPPRSARPPPPPDLPLRLRAAFSQPRCCLLSAHVVSLQVHGQPLHPVRAGELQRRVWGCGPGIWAGVPQPPT